MPTKTPQLPLAANTTKESIEVREGQVWRDLDKRMGNRRCVVVAVSDGKAIMRRYIPGRSAEGSRTRVSIGRMHRSSTGWELVKDAGG